MLKRQDSDYINLNYSSGQRIIYRDTNLVWDNLPRVGEAIKVGYAICTYFQMSPKADNVIRLLLR